MNFPARGLKLDFPLCWNSHDSRCRFPFFFRSFTTLFVNKYELFERVLAQAIGVRVAGNVGEFDGSRDAGKPYDSTHQGKSMRTFGAFSPLPSGLRFIGPPLSMAFRAVVALRLAAYRLKIIRPRQAAVSVISIGNLTVGGTGKTPCAVWMARELKALEFKPAILMRGYGAVAKGCPNDEALLLARLIPDVPLYVGADRHASAVKAAADGCDILILDDGFQHWRLARNCDVVLVDAGDPFGGGHLLPWGFLREGPEALKRADVVIVTRADAVSPKTLKKLKLELTEKAPRAVIASAVHRPTRLRRLMRSEGDGEEQYFPPELVRKVNTVVACGLARPEAFFDSVAVLGARLALKRTYPDHYIFTNGDLAGLRKAAAEVGAEMIVVTEKDAVKIEALSEFKAEDRPIFYALGMEFEINAGLSSIRFRLKTAGKSMAKKYEDPRHRCGREGEEYAWKLLRKKGHQLVERNFRCKVGEVDLITLDRGTLVFCEVRTRRTNAAVSAGESVTSAKQRCVALAARYWLSKHARGFATVDGQEVRFHGEPPMRFDVVALAVDGDKVAEEEHFEGAFVG
jgi:tetraacyldisaccharide 4'-kinase